jgi:hypothetical protein
MCYRRYGDEEGRAMSVQEASAAGRAAKAQGVEAGLFYLRPMAEKPYTVAYRTTETGELPTNAVYEEHKVVVSDARPVASELSLDREGVAFTTSPSRVTDFYDEALLDTLAHAEAAELVAKVTGASRVEVFDHTLRRRAPQVPDRTPGMARQPVLRVHNDYTEGSGPQRVRDLLGEEADELLKRRFAFINVWRPLAGPVLDTPLAVCDARSVGAADWVACDMVYKDRRGEIYVNTYNPGHRWLYFPKMTPDEVILIKCYDTRHDVARFAPHTAFIDPTTPADAPPRESIEIRTVAFFD